LTCWEKMENVWASCSTSCEELQTLGGDGEPWSCKALGPAGASKMAQPSAAAPTSVSLYCFTVVTAQGVCPPGVEEGYEQKLLDEIRQAGLSLFACDASAVYEGKRTETGEWKSIKNTDVFVDVWRKVQAEGLWEQHDWTVKVDTDAVFFPERLKMHLQGSKADPQQPVYFHNIDFKFKFMGALEVLNTEAVRLFLKDIDQCAEHIGNNGGEDIFTMSCLDAIGASYMEDFSLLDDKYSDPADFNLFDVDRCDNDAIVAFHPYKAVNSWRGCHKVATGEVSHTQFTSCVHKWLNEACSLSGDLDHPGDHPAPSTGIVTGPGAS